MCWAIHTGDSNETSKIAQGPLNCPHPTTVAEIRILRLDLLAPFLSRKKVQSNVLLKTKNELTNRNRKQSFQSTVPQQSYGTRSSKPNTPRAATSWQPTPLVRGEFYSANFTCFKTGSRSFFSCIIATNHILVRSF